ncbi:MAG: hypothetical protein U5L00_06915 [Desulfovermiculus sp.]|nr:hypothetical protein [Desulfovermiculus sp.]
MPVRVHYKGDKLKITSWHENHEKLEWLEEWFKSNVTSQGIKEVAITFRHYCENGLPRNNIQKFRHIDGKLCEIKKKQIRLLGREFKDEFCIVDAKIKKKNNLPRNVIDNALILLEKCSNERSR